MTINKTYCKTSSEQYSRYILDEIQFIMLEWSDKCFVRVCVCVCVWGEGGGHALRDVRKNKM